MEYLLQCSSWNGATVNEPKKCEQANKRVSTTEFNKVSYGNVQFSRDWWSAEVRFYGIITEEWLYEKY